MMNIRDIIEEDLVKFNNKEYLFEKIDGKYKGIKFNEFIEKSKKLASYLINNNLKDKNILLIGNNSINFMISDMAITVYTGVCINLSKDIKEDDIDDIIKSLDVSCVIYTNEQEEKLNNINSNVFKVNVDKLDFNKLEVIDNYKEYNNEVCSKIFFSSGTTSKPKGVKLSLKNVFAGWESLQRRTKFNIDDVIYLFLPMHHTYANIYNFYYSLLSGLSIYLSSGLSNVISELKEVNPTIFCGVPLIYEMIYKYVGDDLKNAFGNKIKFLYCGGAPLNEDVRDIYKKNNLELLNAYALTETASSFAISYPNNNDSLSVGSIFEDLDVKVINEENGIGEIVCKGDAVFLGYTIDVKDVFTEDGYFRTGDIGYIKDNKLYLTGRCKKVLLGSNGENIYVEEITSKLKELDNNINYVNVSLNDNKIEVVLYLEDKNVTDVDKLISKYNGLIQKKNMISRAIVSDKKNYQKLVS